MVDMLFKDLVGYFQKIDGTTLRNEKTVILAEILKEASPDEIDKLVYLTLGGLRPAFDRLEFNLAEKMIVRALGVSWDEYQKVGDLGELAYAVTQSHSDTVTQSVSEVYEKLEKIAMESGNGSQDRKVIGLSKLIKEVDSECAKYIVRMVAGKLRLGFSDKTIIDALSYTENGTKEFSEILDRAYQVRPDVGALAQVVKEFGVIQAVAKFDTVMGTPIVPALAQRLKTPVEMIEKMGRVYCEPKYDGTRVQIHFSRKMINNQASNSKQIRNSNSQTGLFGGEEEKPKFWVRTFTRNLDESSEMFPELQRIAEQINADEVILDSEAVGYDPKTGKLVPFQLTITRKRKHGVEETASSVPLRFFIFDIMYKDGKSLIHLPLRERRRILAETVSQGTGEAGLAPTLIVDEFVETDDPDVLREYHKQQLDAGLEGALVKQVEGEYMPGRTGFNWVKFKEAEDSRAKLSDTIDVVIMGYYLGKGKRSGFGLGAFLVGIRGNNQIPSSNNQTNSNDQNINENNILTLAKVGTGITDNVFGELRERLEKIQIKMKETDTPGVWEPFTPGVLGTMTYHVPKILEPDVWVEPEVVVEVAADEITVSPTHSAGYALRFPRLVKFRDDKSALQITTLEEIKTMFGI